MATEPASLIPLMKGVRDDSFDHAWSAHESPTWLTVSTCGFDRGSQAVATCDKESRSPDPGFEYQPV
jgi:hypothetical protein